MAAAKCTSDLDNLQTAALLPYKLAALFEILAAGAAGIAVPLAAGRRFQALNPDGDVFFMIKAFAAGVILATGFVHILPDAFESFSSPCLAGGAWGEFPFAGFVAMAASLGTMAVDSAAAGYYRRMHFGKKGKGGGAPVVAAADDDEESGGEHGGHLHVHTHATHGHAHGDVAVPPVAAAEVELEGLDLIRHRVTSQVLEVGVMIHSVIIGVTLGASGSLATVKPLAAALSFHQFFEGMGLAGCISQAKFKLRTMLTMAIFFSLTTPLGIAIGIGISNVYAAKNSPTSLIVQGILEAASAGILIYMALVDLLAADFKDPRVQKSPTLQLGSNIALLLGAGCMSVLAKWA